MSWRTLRRDFGALALPDGGEVNLVFNIFNIMVSDIV